MIIYPVGNEISSHCLIPQEYDQLRMRYLSHSLKYLRKNMIKPRLLCGRAAGGSEYYTISLAYFVVVILLSCNAAEAGIGINWGRHTSQRLLPSQVVDLILQNGITEARVFTAQNDILYAFHGTGIKLTITLFSISKIDTDEEAHKWVAQRIRFFEASNVWRINVGNLAFNLGSSKTAKDLSLSFAPFERLQKAINNASYGKNIKLTIQYNTAALLKDNITKPSEADFRDEIKEEMLKVIAILRANDSPFVIETFPIPRIASRNWDIDFAFFDNKSERVIEDVHGAVYTNYFEFEYDSVLWALEKMGAPDMRVVVGLIGWPTDGDEAANATMAERFYKGLLPFIASNKGTPKRPGAALDVYVHALTDENKLPYQYPFMRHWGIYRTNGKPKYKIDLTGQGRDIFPAELEGIEQMPARWCMYNGNRKGSETVERWVHYACIAADCTPTWPGGSCGNLGYDQNVSYVFNMFFQSMFQDEKACPTALGLADVVSGDEKDPSTGTCVFPVEVVKGHQDQFIYQYLNSDGSLNKNASTVGRMNKALHNQGNRIHDNVPAAGYSFAIFSVFWIFNLRPSFSELMFSM